MKVRKNPLVLPVVEPWPEPVDGQTLLEELAGTYKHSVVLPKWVPETVSLWTVHTYAFELRNITTYLGVESPEPRCGKSTLLTLLSQLANRAVISSNVSSASFFRVIEELQPTLLIDETDTFMQGKSELRGILNAGYTKETAFVLRMAPQPSPAKGEALVAGQGRETEEAVAGLASFSCWCPKVIARIGRLPATLADRCIVFRMQRKTSSEACERRRDWDPLPLKRRCARFVQDHAEAIARGRPEIPKDLNDRAADIWEPLLILADLAGGPWPELARQAAVGLSASAEERTPMGALLLDIFLVFMTAKAERLFSRDLAGRLNSLGERPWLELSRGKPLTELWLASQLRPYGIRPKTMWIGPAAAKGYLQADFMETFKRYIPRAEIQALMTEGAESGLQQNGDSGAE